MNIKRCPFCGSLGILSERIKWGTKDDKEYYVSCTGNAKCPAHYAGVNPHDTPDEAIKIWNKRQSLDGEGLKMSEQAIANIAPELAAIKEKYRWRKQSEEPAPENERVEICLRGILTGGLRCFDIYGALLETHKDEDEECYWRPLDMPDDK